MLKYEERRFDNLENDHEKSTQHCDCPDFLTLKNMNIFENSYFSFVCRWLNSYVEWNEETVHIIGFVKIIA